MLFNTVYFPVLRCFSGLSVVKYLAGQKTKLWKVDERISETEIVSREATGNTGRKLGKLGELQSSIKTRRLYVDEAGLHNRNFFKKKKNTGK